MSIAIDPARILAVLLPDGIWHEVAEGTFALGPYEFLASGDRRIGFGEGGNITVPSTGATWKEYKTGERYACPMTSIKAVRFRETDSPPR